MRARILLLVASLLAATIGLRADTASDDFAGSGALSANWEITDGGISRVSGVPKADALDTNCFARWIGHTFGSDQSIQMTVVDGAPFSVLTLHADGNPATSWNLYRTYHDSFGTTKLERWTAGIDTEIGSAAVVAGVGETFAIRRSGGNVIVEVEGVPIITVADSTHTGGSPGFGYVDMDGNAALDDAVLGGISATSSGSGNASGVRGHGVVPVP
jgi:hypothetical protein